MRLMLRNESQILNMLLVNMKMNLCENQKSMHQSTGTHLINKRKKKKQ